MQKTPQNSLLERQKIGITSLWEDLEDKLLTPGHLLGFFYCLGVKRYTVNIFTVFVMLLAFHNYCVPICNKGHTRYNDFTNVEI